AYLSCSQKLRDRHEEVINLLVRPSKARDALMADIDNLLKQHVELCEAVNILGEATPRIIDAVLSFGERLSTRVVASALRARGVQAQAFDAGACAIAADRHGSATPQWQETQARVNGSPRPVLERGVTPVLTGFLGATRDRHQTTLGRGGSDFS